jgi:hypothetical protein
MLNFSGLYFVFIACLQAFSGLSSTGQYGFALTLLFVVVLQMLRDGYEDIVSLLLRDLTLKESVLPR